MNWFTIAGTVLHVLKNVPEMVDDVEDFWEKLTAKTPAPEEHAEAVQNAISEARAG